MDDERVYLTVDEAIRMLPNERLIHTYRQGDGFSLCGAHWTRDLVVAKIRIGKPELSGETATSMRHGLTITDEHGRLWIETKQQTEVERLRAELEHVRADARKIAHALLAPYARALKEDTDAGGFAISIVEFPGCYSEGETYEEALDNIEEAAVGWMLAALEQGQTIPEPAKRRYREER